MPPTEKAAERRRALVRAAATLLPVLGLRGTTTRAVTDHAGVGTGLLNHYFRWPELRAAAWGAVFDAVAETQYADGAANPSGAMERYCTTAFMEESRPYWQLWIEACDLAPADPALARELARAQARLTDGLAETLRHGVAAGCWTLADPAATAVRLGALHDGLVALLLSGIGGIGPAEAERHLRTAFALECGLPADRARP